MLKVIVNAYTMCPGMGSEQGMAWNWCSNLAKHCELYIITESEYKDKILSVVKKSPYAENMHFLWNEVSPTVREAAFAWDAASVVSVDASSLLPQPVKSMDKASVMAAIR
jgi:hypothetical protein